MAERNAPSKRPRQRTTIADVAARAGLSTATVSRVLNGTANVGEDLAERVKEAARQLGYQPNALGRALRRQVSDIWSLIISDIENPFFTGIARGIEDVAASAGYAVVLCNSDEDVAKEAAYIQLALQQRVSGVVIAPTSESQTDVRPLVAQDIPVVTVDRTTTSGALDSVMLDNVRGAYLGTRHLIEQGFRRIALLGGPPEATSARLRRSGYRLALRDARIPWRRSLEFPANFKQDGGYRAMNRIIDSKAAPEAVLIANNLMTLGALEALAERRPAAGAGPAIVAFDEFSWGGLLSPPMTVIAQPIHEIGRTAGELLLARIKNPDGVVQHIVLQPELKVRQSSLRHPPDAPEARTRSGR